MSGMRQRSKGMAPSQRDIGKVTTNPPSGGSASLPGSLSPPPPPPPPPLSLSPSKKLAATATVAVATRTSITSKTLVTAAAWDIASDDDDDSSALHLEPRRAFHPLHKETSVVELVHVPSSPESGGTRRRKVSSSSSAAAFHDPATPHYQHQQQSYYRSLQAVPISPVSGLGRFPTMRKAHAVPDAQYHHYVRGRRQGQERPLMNAMCCANLCAGVSIVAIVFLVFIGILLDKQPLYIKGVLPKHLHYVEGSNRAHFYYITSPSERLETASNAYKAALLYLFTAVACLSYAQNWAWQIRSRFHQYNEIPDADSTIPSFHTGGYDDENSGYQNNTMMASMSRLPTQAYQYNKRISSKIWNCLAFSTNRFGIWIASVMTSRSNRPRRRAPGAKDV